MKPPKHYTQKVIPAITTPVAKGKTIKQAVEGLMSVYRRRFMGKSVVNRHTGITIQFSGRGRNKTVSGGGLYPSKIAAIYIIDKIMEQSWFVGFGKRKPTDTKTTIGYMNFACYCMIDGQKRIVRTSVYMEKGGKYYYSLHIPK